MKICLYTDRTRERKKKNKLKNVIGLQAKLVSLVKEKQKRINMHTKENERKDGENEGRKNEKSLTHNKTERKKLNETIHSIQKK
jgi:hypothetical protein